MDVSNREPLGEAQLRAMRAYVAELELEVDRLRRRSDFLQQVSRDYVRETALLCQGSKSARDPVQALEAVAGTCEELERTLRDLEEPTGHQPVFDRALAIAVRPLAEVVFRWQRRLNKAADAVLRLDLQTEQIVWFPVRFRHILDILVSNALRYRDTDKGEVRLGFSLAAKNEGYELRFTDNGRGMSSSERTTLVGPLPRPAPAPGGRLSVGLPVLKLLVEQCCGTISVDSVEDRGTSIMIMLPRFEIDDHIERGQPVLGQGGPR